MPGKESSRSCDEGPGPRRTLRTELVEVFVIIVALGAWGMSLAHPQHLGALNLPSRVITLFEVNTLDGPPWGPWEEFTDVLDDPPPHD